MKAWNNKRKQSSAVEDGGAAELPPSTSYLTNRTSEKPFEVLVLLAQNK